MIAQAVSGILCLIYMKKKFDILKMHREETRISTYHLYRLCMMGIPMGLQYSITAIGSVVIQTAINSLGSIAVASVTAGQKIGMFFCCPFDALGGTMQPMPDRMPVPVKLTYPPGSSFSNLHWKHLLGFWHALS